jgi:hypothetical protein
MHGRYATRSELWTWAAVIETMRCRTRVALGEMLCPTTDPIFAIGQPRTDSHQPVRRPPE